MDSRKSLHLFLYELFSVIQNSWFNFTIQHFVLIESAQLCSSSRSNFSWIFNFSIFSNRTASTIDESSNHISGCSEDDNMKQTRDDVLVDLVEEESVLWKRNHPNFKNQLAKEQAWLRIATKLGVSSESLFVSLTIQLSQPIHLQNNSVPASLMILLL